MNNRFRSNPPNSGYLAEHCWLAKPTVLPSPGIASVADVQAVHCNAEEARAGVIAAPDLQANGPSGQCSTAREVARLASSGALEWPARKPVLGICWLDFPRQGDSRSPPGNTGHAAKLCTNEDRVSFSISNVEHTERLNYARPVE
jgi:hypothetical protein